MAQTTGQITGKDLEIQLSTDGTNYTDYSGSTNAVEPSGGERSKGELHTFDTDYPLIATGKRAAVTVKIKVVYTEVSGEAADTLHGYYVNDTPVYLRFRPRGTAATRWQFTGGPGYITTMVAPQLDAGNGEPVAVSMEWYGPALTQSAQT